jgi:hypothetical protein
VAGAVVGASAAPKIEDSDRTSKAAAVIRVVPMSLKSDPRGTEKQRRQGERMWTL